MAPAKRKRNNGDPGEGRPSPHRPQATVLGQHDRGAEMRDTGRRSSRGGQGGMGRGGRRNDNRENVNKLTAPGNGRATPTSGPMSPPPPRPSSAMQTPTQTPTPVNDLPSQLPKRDPMPFDYIFLTEDRLSSWEATGRQEVVANGIQARQDEDGLDLASILQELVRATLDGRMDPTTAGTCVKEILGPDTSAEGDSSTFDPHTTFLDILSMLYDAEDGPMNHDLRAFATSTGISPQIMRQKLDGPFLQDLGLARDTFLRVGVRQATNLLYRQANYNLLREESEGYSKLVTELFTTCASEPPSSEVVVDAFERVKGLIGTFDLDVGRVLDITLDVFASVLIKHFRFFIKLLRVSSWWPRKVEIDGTTVSRCGGLPNWALPSSSGWLPEKEEEEVSRVQRQDRDKLFWARARDVGLDAFFELGGHQLVDEEIKKRIVGGKRELDAELDIERQWIEITGTFPPSGNRVAAQLLGFKLRFYTSTARDKEDVLPSNLIYLAALLIKIGFISLRDLYAHLWPLDEDMPAVRNTRLKELEEKERLSRGGGASNALTMAGALPDDTLPNNGRTREAAAKPDTTTKVSTDPEDKGPADQKVQLLQCLLTIGAIPEALFILGRFPWLVEAYPDLTDHINRILNHAVKDVYEPCRPVSTTTAVTTDVDCPTIKYADLDQTSVPKGQVRLTQLPTKKQLRWPFPDKCEPNENVSYRFYWDEWTDNIPVCRTVDDIFTLCSTFLNLSGVSIGKDPSLLSKLARIGATSLANDTSPQNLDRWQDLLKRLLVPALSLTKSNTSVVNEIYGMLRYYPVSVRYSIYAEWYEGTVSRHPAMKLAFARAKYETERTMKRISLTNLTAMARTLAKTAYGCPGIVFKIALSQIEAYSNLTEVVVECAKYFTDLGYDVLVWSLLSSLGGKDRNRNNAEFALLPSRWLLALSRFSGKVFRRYSIMNLSPIVQYVSDQLYHGNSTDLVILKELIAQMSGIVPDTDYNDAQLAAMTGGEALRKQTLINLQDKRYESTKTSKRLMRALTETRLAGELLVGIAQHRQAAIYKIPDEDAHIKLLATMIDDTQLILFQYLDLLRSNLSPDDFEKQVPSVPELLEDYGLDPALAFLIGRVGLAYHRSKVQFPTKKGAPKALAGTLEAPSEEPDADGDTGMENISTEENSESQVVVNGEAVLQEDVTMLEAKAESPSEVTSMEKVATPLTDPYREIMEPIVASVQKILPQGTFKSLSPEFYTFFWTCSLGDLAVPSASYDAEISRLLAKEKERPAIDHRGDSSRAIVAARKEKDDAKKADAETRGAILSEFRKAVTGFGLKKARLLRNKASWFDKSVRPDDMSVSLLERCLIPRLLLSPSDADYAFKMIKFLHDNAVPQFRTLSLYGQIFRANRLRSIIFTCTVREAENLGRFLRLALSDLARWHADKAIYDKEACGGKNLLPGFAKAIDEEGKPKGCVSYDGNKGFKSILFHWHKNLNTALRDCLEGTEWMHIRNAITILKSVVEVFPAVDFMGNSFIKQLQAITEREKSEHNGREDLLLTGNGVLVQLKKRAKKWVMVQSFSHILVDSSQPNGSPATGKATPTLGSRTPLKPNAPEFKPQPGASSLGTLKSKPTTQEVEDGEVDDAKTAATASKAPLKPVVSSNDAVEIKPPPAATGAMESKKSEILDRREQIKRENALKAASLPAAPVPRPVMDRNSPNLPNRPDAPFPPPRDLIDRHQPARHVDRRDSRETRLPDPRALDRLVPRPGDRGRDYSAGDRRGPDPIARDFGRPNGGPPGVDRERTRPDPPPRWISDSSRENIESHDRLNNGSRAPENGRLSRDLPPPRSSSSMMDRGSIVNLDRMPLLNPERQELINPDRAALISADKDLTRSDSPRRGRDEVRERGLSRVQSPRRNEKDYTESRRDDRRTGPPDVYDNLRDRVEEIQPPPAGPRSDRNMDRDRNAGPDRTMFQQTHTHPSPRSTDPDHGRLNTGRGSQPDPNFGRLNQISTPEIPLGPRDMNSRGTRPANPVPPPRRDVKADIPRPPTPEKQPPTGPSGRMPRRTAPGQVEPSLLTNSDSGVASPASAIHPDRLAQLGPSTVQTSQQPIPIPQVSTPPIHPDRMKAFGNDTPTKPSPPAPQMLNNYSRQQLPHVATNGPPSGPKASQSSPVTTSVNGFAAPTGPSAATDRAARGGRRQLAGINTMLQQAGQQHSTPDRGPSLRVRGRHNSGIGPEMPISGPATPIVPPPPYGPLPPVRHDMSRDVNKELINPERADLITGGPAVTDDRERGKHDRRDRSGRQSRRNSKSPNRERDSKHSTHEERARRPEYQDRSDRRPGDSDRERQHRPATPTKDLLPSRDASSRDSGRDREHREREGSRRTTREHDGAPESSERNWAGERSGDRAGRSREVRGEDRRDSRGNREDGGSGRKRRVDEGPSSDSRGHDKRPRR